MDKNRRQIADETKKNNIRPSATRQNGAPVKKTPTAERKQMHAPEKAHVKQSKNVPTQKTSERNAPPRPVKKALPKKASTKKAKRILTPEQKAKLEARRKAKREATKRMLARLGTVLVIFLTCYLTVSLIIAGLLRANFNSVKSDIVRTVRIYQPKKNPANENEKEKLIDEYTSIVGGVDSGLYISYPLLSTITDVSSIGDITKLTVVFRDHGDVIDCTAFSNSIYINGIPVSLSTPVIMTNGEYYFPLEILEKYSRGLNITTEKDKDGNSYCKMIFETYGGTIAFINHRDHGTVCVAEPTDNNQE